MTLDEMLDEDDFLQKKEMFMLNDILNNRIREIKRKELIDTVLKSREEYKSGKAVHASVQDIMNEILS
jgi:hypothetical protein